MWFLQLLRRVQQRRRVWFYVGERVWLLTGQEEY